MHKTKIKFRALTHATSLAFSTEQNPLKQKKIYRVYTQACDQSLLRLWVKKSAFILFIFLLQPHISLAQTVIEQGNVPSEFARHGLETLNKMIGAVNVFLALLFIVSIIGFVISGIKFIIAGGDEGTLESARKTGIASVVGFLLSLVGYVIINIIKHFIV